MFVLCQLLFNKNTAVKQFNMCNLSTLSRTHSISSLLDKSNYGNKCLVYNIYAICIYFILLKLQYHKNRWFTLKSQEKGPPLNFCMEYPPNL